MAEQRAIDLERVMAEFTKVGAAQQAQDAALRQQEADLTKSVETEVSSLNREAELTAEMAGLIDEILLKRADRNKQAAAEFGTNQDASTYVIGELAKASRENTEMIRASAMSIQEKMAVGPGEDVLDWITNQFTIPSDVKAHNALVAQQEIVDTAITRLQNQTQEQFKINNAIDANTSKKIIELNSAKVLAAAAVKAENARQEALKTNINVGSVRLATNQQAFANALALIRAEIDLQQLQIGRARNQLDEDLKRERLEKMQREEKSDADLQKDLDRATALHGMRRITPEQFRRMSGPMRTALEYTMADPSMMQGRLGPNPSVAVEMASLMNSPLTPATQTTKEALINIMVTAQNRPDWAALKPEQKQAAHNKAIRDEVDKQLKNIPDSNSMFSAPPLNSLGKIPAVEGTKLWKDHLAPLATNVFAPTSANQVFKFALDAVKEGKMPLDQAAADVAIIYTSAVADNWHNRDYGRFSLQIPERYRHSYYTRISGPYRFGSEQPIDMTNPTAVKNMMLRHLNVNKAIEEEVEFRTRFLEP